MGQVYAVHDNRLKEECLLQFGTVQSDGTKDEEPHRVLFQFPPKILSDNRKGTWEEGEMRGTEPFSTFKTSGPREITLSWTYIVDGNEFTTDVIAAQVKAVRGYFAGIRALSNEGRNLVILFKYILYGSLKNPMSARIKSIDVKHGDTIICPVGRSGTSDVNRSYPLRTDITVDLRLWTQGGAAKVVDVEGLIPEMTADWY